MFEIFDRTKVRYCIYQIINVVYKMNKKWKKKYSTLNVSLKYYKFGYGL